MIHSSLWTHIAAHLSEVTAYPCTIRHCQAVSGGCINTTWKISSQNRDYFVKIQAASSLAVFEAEAAGLAELAATHTVRVPLPLCWGSTDGKAYLVLEYLPLGRKTPSAMATLGRQLALLHRQPRPYFGWERDNTIGSTPQLNGRSTQWLEFWRERRLGFQLELAARNGYRGKLQRQGKVLLTRLAGLLPDPPPTPALLHGDLWAGNVGCLPNGEPVVFDPAVYYGDREADLAMTELFGGFTAEFYAAYTAVWPLVPGYRTRRTVYNLYHILNHLNLFGGGYLAQAERMIDQLVAELG